MDVKAILCRLFNLNTEGAAATDSVEVVGDEMTGVTGFLSYRRRLKIKRGDSTTSVFLKFSDKSRTDLGQTKDFSDHFCPRECLFYGSMAPLLQRTATQFDLGCISLPTVHHELVLPSGSLLVMEDLCEAGFQLAPPKLNLGEARCVVSGLANLQAAFWLTKAKLGPAAAGIIGPDSPLADFAEALACTGTSLEDLLSICFDGFRLEFPKYLKSEKRVAIIDAYFDDGFLDKARQVMEANKAEKEVIGLNHTDFWFNNLMLRRNSGGQAVETRLLDWQFFGIGGLAYDLGPFWLSSIDNSIAVEEFLPCVQFYHESIRSIYEAKMQEPFPVSLDQMKQQAFQSLRWGIAWVVLFAEALWSLDSVSNILANVADFIEHFKL